MNEIPYPVGQGVGLQGPARRRRIRGVALIESLVAVPVVLWLGLSVLQWALVFHARYAVSFALTESARLGSVDHAEPEAIRRGLARGIVPYLYGAQDAASFQQNMMRAREHIAFGEAQGWIRLRQLSPTDRSFMDWGQPARDDEGQLIAGQVEIPIDSLKYRVKRTEPASGVSGYRTEERIGSASGQTLADAHLLKLEMIYGVPLGVPLVGRFAAWIMSRIDDCGSSDTMRLGLMDLRTERHSGDSRGRLAAPGADDPSAHAAGRPWACAFYQAKDDHGQSVPRWPVRMSAVVRMQSPPRHAGLGTEGDEAFAASSTGSISGPLREGASDGSSEAVAAGPSDRVSASGQSSGQASGSVLGALRPVDPFNSGTHGSGGSIAGSVDAMMGVCQAAAGAESSNSH